MPTAAVQKSFTYPGYSFREQSGGVSFDADIAYEVALPALVAAQANGTLTTRTDDNTGVVTLATGHGILTNDVVDVYWAAGVRYGMDATVSGSAVTVDGGAGDVLPSESTTGMQVVKQTEINPLNLDGDAAQVVGVLYRNAQTAAAKAHVDLQDSGSATIAEHDLVVETQLGGLNHVTNIAGGDANIYTGNPITKGFASHNATTAGTLYVLAGIDSTP
jgi:hypothetical protein